MSAPINTQAIIAEALFSTEQLVDAYGTIDAEIKALEKRKEAMRKALVATGKDLLDGHSYVLTIDISERRTLPIEKAEKAFGKDAVAAIVNVSDVYTLRAKEK
jgi:hypothetical protein